MHVLRYPSVQRCITETTFGETVKARMKSDCSLSMAEKNLRMAIVHRYEDDAYSEDSATKLVITKTCQAIPSDILISRER